MLAFAANVSSRQIEKGRPEKSLSLPPASATIVLSQLAGGYVS
jgi:hypothetical protein